jgi:hypothetical protein
MPYKTNNKPYCQGGRQTQAACEPRSREIFTDFFKQIFGVDLIDGRNKFGVDMVAIGGSVIPDWPIKTPYLEIANRPPWTTTPMFPTFDSQEEKSVHLEDRKYEFLMEAPFGYWYGICNNTWSRIGLASPEVVLKYMDEKYASRNNNRCMSNEKFYNIPIEELFYFVFNMKEGLWKPAANTIILPNGLPANK